MRGRAHARRTLKGLVADLRCYMLFIVLYFILYKFDNGKKEAYSEAILHKRRIIVAINTTSFCKSKLINL